MRKAYSAARPVSDPVASRNATLKMIRLCAKHQPQAEEYGRASNTDKYTAYSVWGCRSEEGGGFTPALAIKEVDEMYIQKKLHPTHPVSLCPADWYFADGAWQVYQTPDWRELLSVQFPPSVSWFSVRLGGGDTPPEPPTDPREVRASAMDYMRRNMEVPPAIAAAWERIREQLHRDVVERAESVLRQQIEYNGRIVTVDPEHPATITFTEN